MLPCPKDLQTCTGCALLIVAESDSTTNPLGLDDCRFGPTSITLELDPPQKVLGYEYWDNDNVPTDVAERSRFTWRNSGSTPSQVGSDEVPGTGNGQGTGFQSIAEGGDTTIKPEMVRFITVFLSGRGDGGALKSIRHGAFVKKMDE